MLTADELERYSRQISIFGEEGQLKLKRTKVLIAGAGGLGSASATYLAVAGIGKMRIVDHDVVALSNLNRQILHWDSDIGKRKIDSARTKLKAANPHLDIEAVAETISEANAATLVGDCDLIVDAMDNFAARYVLNRVALDRKIPFFHGAVHGFYGQATTIIPGSTACFRCIFPEAPSPSPPPVVGVAPGIVGCIQASEVLKYILDIGCVLENRLLMWDGLRVEMNEIPLEKNPYCKDCG